MITRKAVTFVPRDAPLAPCGVVAFGGVARMLAERALVHLEGAYAGLEGVVGKDVIVLLGEEGRLPFADGVVYVGVERGTPSVLVRTTHAANVPAQWLDTWLREQAVPLPAVLLAREDGVDIIPVGAARPVTHEALRAFLAEAGDP